MSDTQTLEGIKRAAPRIATHYHIGLQVYLHKDKNLFGDPWLKTIPASRDGWKPLRQSNEWVDAGVASGEIIALADIPADDMAESMPFELLEGDQEERRSKYHREIKPGVWVDCYDVLKAFDVRCPALQHMIKKCLAPGQRGHKDLEQDMNDIVASAERARELAQC